MPSDEDDLYASKHVKQPKKKLIHSAAGCCCHKPGLKVNRSKKDEAVVLTQGCFAARGSTLFFPQKTTKLWTRSSGFSHSWLCCVQCEKLVNDRGSQGV